MNSFVSSSFDVNVLCGHSFSLVVFGLSSVFDVGQITLGDILRALHMLILQSLQTRDVTLSKLFCNVILCTV